MILDIVEIERWKSTAKHNNNDKEGFFFAFIMFKIMNVFKGKGEKWRDTSF